MNTLLRKIRKARELTQKQVADKIHCSVSGLSYQENNLDPKMDFLKKWCKGMDIKLSSLIEQYLIKEGY